MHKTWLPTVIKSVGIQLFLTPTSLEKAFFPMEFYFRGKVFLKKLVNSCFAAISPPASCEISSVAVNHPMLNCHRSSKPYGASFNSLMFSLGGVSVENFAKKPKLYFGPLTTMKKWKGLNWVFHTLVGLRKTIGHYRRSRSYFEFSTIFRRERSSKSIFILIWRFRVNWRVFNWLENAVFFTQLRKKVVRKTSWS